MTTVFYLVITIGIFVAIGTIYLAYTLVVDTYRNYRGKMIVTCPETHKNVAVEVDTKHAIGTASLDAEPEIRLKSCTRWPERQDCGQECLKELTAAPHECMVRTIVKKWYEGKSCTICGDAIKDWADHHPALLTSDNKTIGWDEARPEELPELMSNAKPVCWSCHMTEKFRREHPELVVDNPWKKAVGHASK